MELDVDGGEEKGGTKGKRRERAEQREKKIEEVKGERARTRAVRQRLKF